MLTTSMISNTSKCYDQRISGSRWCHGFLYNPQGNKSVSSEGYSAQTELSITVNVRFTNTKNHTEDFEKQFTSAKTYDTTQSLASVQEELVTQIIKDLVDQIFNATVANW